RLGAVRRLGDAAATGRGGRVPPRRRVPAGLAGAGRAGADTDRRHRRAVEGRGGAMACVGVCNGRIDWRGAVAGAVASGPGGAGAARRTAGEPRMVLVRTR